MTKRNSINELNKVCKSVLKLEDEDFAEVEKMHQAQEGYSHPLKNATAARLNQLGEYNRQVTEVLKNLWVVLKVGVTKEKVQAPFGSYAAHQPNYEGFKQLGKLDDYVFQSLVHIGNSSHHLSWGLTVLENTEVPKEFQEEIRQAAIVIGNLQEKLRSYQK